MKETVIDNRPLAELTRSNTVRFMVDGHPIWITANGSSLEIKASAEISIVPVDYRSITISHKIFPCSAAE